MRKKDFLKNAILYETSQNDLYARVIDDIITRATKDYAENGKMLSIVKGVDKYTREIIERGGCSGVIRDLMYCYETDAFFAKYKRDILDVLYYINWFDRYKYTLATYWEEESSINQEMVWATYERIAEEIQSYLFKTYLCPKWLEK